MGENSSLDSCILANLRPLQRRSCTSCLSSTSLAFIADLVRWYLPILTLVRFKLVNREWKAWCDANLLELAKERRKDEASRDWYFPITFGNHLHNTCIRKWHGVHRWSKLQDTLPDLDFLPDDNLNCFPRSSYEIEAVSSGLLVLSKVLSSKYFTDLIVCNPLSKKWRQLPRNLRCRDRSRHEVSGEDIHTLLVVDEFSNQYKLIQISRWCINIYRSSSNDWDCSPLNMSSSFNPADFTGCFNGRVYTMRPDVPFYWRYSLSIYDIESRVHEARMVTLDFQHELLEEYWRRPGNPILVECMGDLYAVAVSCQARHNNASESNRGSTSSVRTTFRISKLTEEGEWNVKGSWNRVGVPLEMEVSEPDLADACRRFREFSCVARSSIICLASLAWKYGYYIQCDVVSGLSTKMCSAFAVRGNKYDRREKHMAYTPSLDLEP